MEAILAFFKKIGLPGVIAAIVSAVVTMIPFLFQIDERYAKADDLEKQITTVTKQINDLTIEVGRLAGTQFGVGVSYPLTKQVSLTGDYRYQVGQSRVSAFDGNAFYAGVKYAF